MTEAAPTPPTVFVVSLDYGGTTDVIGVFATFSLARAHVYQHIVAVSDPKNGDTVPASQSDVIWERYEDTETKLPYFQCGWDDMEFQIAQWTVQQ